MRPSSSPRRTYGIRNSRLRRLGYESYREYLQSPHWLRTRERYWASEDVPRACVCGETEDINLHHTTYERVGAEELSDLRPLCRRCHNLVHVLERRGELGIDLDGLLDSQRALGYRVQLEAIADRRAGEDREQHEMDAEAFAALSLPERLQVLLRLAEFSREPHLRGSIRHVEHAIRALQKQLMPETIRRAA